MITLRNYQNGAVHELREGFRIHQRQVLANPTGSGKTLIFSYLAAAAYAKGTQTLILTHRSALLTQTMSVVGTHKIPIQIINAETKQFDKFAPLSIGMVETIKRRKLWETGYAPKLIIIDEGHFGNFTPILEAFPNAKVICCTATPVGKHFYQNYTNIVQTADVSELVAAGYLVRCHAFQMQDEDGEIEKIKIVRGEFEEKGLFKAFNKAKLYKGVVDKYLEKLNGVKTLVFNCNVKHSERMTEEFNKAGIASECITSNTSPEEQVRILDAFKNDYIKVLNNANILVAGYDDPSVGGIILNRATHSLPLFLQALGRGARPNPGKKEFICIDMGLNHSRFGTYEQPREWKLEAPKKKKNGPAPVRSCPACTAMLAASAAVCTFCGFIFPKKTHEEKNGVLVEIINNVPVQCAGKKLSEMSVHDLIALQKVKKLIPSHIWRLLRSRGEVALTEYASLMEYKTGWLMNQIGEIGDNKFRDYVIS